MKRINFKIHLVIILMLSVLTATSSLFADDKPKSNVDVFVATGVRALPGVMWGFIPSPVSAAVAVDINRIRIRGDFSYHLAVNAVHSTAGGGYLFIPKGKNAAETGGFQLKIPIMFDAGIISGTTEADDGYDDKITWLLLGPSASVDFSWWKAHRLGFTISFKVGYDFAIDLDSTYPDGYSSAEDTIGIGDVSVLFGITI
ncbi:MAG: hypothetical protein JXR91_08645 [Deltaproteobacteria bacterium]|nr:hypothetical protein [Deltaproteobacteria bacterium]